MNTRPPGLGWYFADPKPSRSVGSHMLVIEFTPDAVIFACATDAPPVLLERMQWLLEELVRAPGALAEACGQVGEARQHFIAFESDDDPDEDV